jgi:hypothetical protein
LQHLLFDFGNEDNNLAAAFVTRQNRNAKNIGNLTTLLKPHNIGTHLEGIETSFQVVLWKSFHVWASYITF